MGEYMDSRSLMMTGAGGYIGRHVVTALLDRGLSVTAVDIETKRIDHRANRVALDIFDSNDGIWERLGKPKVCLHLAWRDGFRHNSNSHLVDLPRHYVFLRRLLDSGLEQLAVMGSMHEVGYWFGEVDENTPTNPTSLYGIAKNSLRQATQLIAAEREVVLQWLRAFYIIGDDLSNQSLFSRILQMELEGKETFPFTSGENKYDFIRIEDLAHQIASCVLQTKIAGIINCCTGRPVSLRETVEQFIRDHNLKIRPAFGEYPERPYDSPAIWGSVDKINAILASAGSSGRANSR